MRWGERLEFVADAGPGDFIFVPPYVPHQEINALTEETLSCVVVRSGQEPVVVNLDLPDVAGEPERVRWVDDIHSYSARGRHLLGGRRPRRLVLGRRRRLAVAGARGPTMSGLAVPHGSKTRWRLR